MKPQTRNPKPETRNRHARHAFTLIELLLVLVILGILAAIVVPKFANRGEQARQTAARTQIAAFSTALSAFEVDNGYYPRGKDGLQALLQKPNEAPNWRGPYLEEQGGIPNDPWQRPYLYECPGKHNVNSYDISSMGFDGREGTEDDITNWQLGR
jgi:general secretion pathway protein G